LLCLLPASAIKPIPNSQQSVSFAVPFTNLKPIPNQQLVLRFAVPFTSLSITCKNAGQNHFAKTGFDFSSFNFLSQGHS
jgi:hypothetical protein